MSELIFLDPAGKPGVPAEAYTPRVAAGDKPRLVLLANGFTDSEEFLEDVGAAIGKLMPIAGVSRFLKGEQRSVGGLMTDEQIDAVMSLGDAVVAAIGHCGSCSASIVRAACRLGSLGKPVVAMVTEKFAESARFTALAAGMPEVPIVIVPHPIAGQDADFHAAVAARVAPALVAALREGRSAYKVPGDVLREAA